MKTYITVLCFTFCSSAFAEPHHLTEDAVLLMANTKLKTSGYDANVLRKTEAKFDEGCNCWFVSYESKKTDKKVVFVDVNDDDSGYANVIDPE